MKTFKSILPSVIMILLGIAIGVLLIIDAEKLTEIVFRLFGAALLVLTLVMVIRYLNAKKNGEENVMMLMTAIFAFILGMVMLIGAKWIVEAGTTICAIFYGAVMIVNGILKICRFISLKKQKAAVSAVLVFSGILSVALGVIALVFCSEALQIVGTIIGIALIVEAVLDLIALVIGRRQNHTLSLYDTSGDDSDYDLE